ncbi:hypothetical protein F9B85_04005 [Heliorestis acidaminivorans]|uniref:SLH domain-containing protein n=1 Tax=Heliorestis acidaminivorans TaxID=553427 RepID=A0A6I0EW05_9FIRM|nr:hypothetical protein [Heliorestis acidaminivorans]KAB2953789.1 hypothetical protein F9B85_04005 [Heliorestis acidaminivorans]
MIDVHNYKKYISKKIIICVLSASVIFPVPNSAQAVILPPEIEGVPYYQNLILNGSYTDATGHWAQEALYIAGIHNLLRADQGQIRPDGPLTRRDALLALANMNGWMEEVQREEARNNPNRPDPLITWTPRLIETATNKGLFEGQEEVGRFGPQTPYWNEAITREQMAIWTARSLQIEPVFGATQTKVYSFDDWKSLNANTLPWMEGALQQGLLNGSSQNGRLLLNPTRPMTRAEGAFLLKNSLPKALANQGRSVFVASIYDIDQVGAGPGGTPVRRIHIAGPQGEKRSILLTGPYSGNPWGQGVAVWKNGPTDGYALTVGDQIEVYSVNANQSATANGLNQPIAGQPSLPSTFSTRDPQQATTASTEPLQIHFIRVLTTDSTLEGTLMDYDPASGYVIVQDPWGQLRHGHVVPGATVHIGGLQKTMDVVPNGTYITARAVGERIVSLEADLPVMNPGTIPENSKVREGRVRAIEPQGLRLVDQHGQEVYYPFSPGLEVRVGQQFGRLSDLRIGDPVVIRLSDYRGAEIARIDIPTINRVAEGVYRGTIEFINQITRVATLRNVQKFSGNQWQSQPGQVQVRLQPSSSIMIHGRPVTADSFLRNGRGQEVLFSASNNFDGLRASRLSVMASPASQSFNDRFSALDIPGGTLRLHLMRDQMSFDDGTIVLRDGRLTDVRDLQNGDAIHIFADATALGYRAALIVAHKDVMPIAQHSDGPVQGSIREISNDGTIELYFYSHMRNNTWDSFSRQDDKAFIKPAPDTVIYDYRGLVPERNTIGDFLTDGFSGRFDHSFIYAFVQDGRPVAITMHNASQAPSTDQPPQEKATLARIDQINPTNQRIVIKDLRDWTENSQRWDPDPVTLSLNAQKAIIMRNQEQITFEDLRPNDTILVIRHPRTHEAHFIFVQ